ncbi:hypothetical protein TELCIR_21276 [Teladorsagia circumcincta]|uniref:CRAL-TRIO domain-containing protein n=1 Tax=Teladorsagia circumcincta TaxID=45464 RepID=A0A2G9TH85_TELCI|nr:hypothetical protein TELCIR_21276 [Teladorsagia circumcincta]
MEANTGVQCYVYYVFDLDGLSFNPSLLGTVSGPFRVQWQLIFKDYPEFIDRFIFVNTPSYISVLGRALAAFVPDKTQNRVAVAGRNCSQDILEFADRDCLPERYGGEIPDEKVLRYVAVVNQYRKVGKK